MSAALLAGPRWLHLAQEGLSSSDTHSFWQAARACRILGHDTFAELLTRIEADPLDGPWFQAWDGADQSRAETLVEHAVRLLDLDGIASGPSTEIGFGPSFRQHTALSWTLQGIRAYPGAGNDILAVALHSPLSRTGTQRSTRSKLGAPNAGRPSTVDDSQALPSMTPTQRSRKGRPVC